MLMRTQRIESYISEGYVSIIGNIISIDTDTWPCWLQNDMFYVDLVQYVDGDVIFKLVGEKENISTVFTKISIMIPKLQYMMVESGIVKSISIDHTSPTVESKQEIQEEPVYKEVTKGSNKQKNKIVLE